MLTNDIGDRYRTDSWKLLMAIAIILVVTCRSTVMETPGHSIGSVTFVLDRDELGICSGCGANVWRGAKRDYQRLKTQRFIAKVYNILLKKFVRSDCT